MSARKTRRRADGLAAIARLTCWLAAAWALPAAVVSRRRRAPGPTIPRDVQILGKQTLYRELCDDEWRRPPRRRRTPGWTEDHHAARERYRW